VKVERLTLRGVSEVKSFVNESDIRNGNLTFGSEDPSKKNKNSDATRLKIARRAAKEVKNGMNINLGIGIPTLLPTVLPEDVQINLESENGIMGVGSYPTLQEATGRNINAGKVKLLLLRKQLLSNQVALISHHRSHSQSFEEVIWI
jgi:hypothetical protein